MSQSRLTSGKANKREVRTNTKQNETTNAQGSQTNSPKQTKKNKPRQQPKPQPQKREGQRHQPGQRTTRQAGKTKHSGGAGGSRQAETRKQERADAREGSRGRKEKATQAKVGACGFSGVQRGFWITRGQIPQRRSEGHMNNTHSMVERAKPHTGPKPLLPWSGGKTRANSHDTPCQRYDNRTVANTTRYPEGGTSKTDWTRKHQRTTKGGGKGGRQERAGHTASTQAARTDKGGGNNNAKTREQQQQKGRTRQPQEENNTRSQGQGQPNKNTTKASKRCTAERYGPKHTTQKNASIIREDEHTCPVFGQTYPHSMLKMKLGLWKFKQNCSALVNLRASTQ